jgi:dolichol kinase
VTVLPYLAVVCAASTVVESLPINNWLDDNISVPLVATITSLGVLPLAAAASAMLRASGQPVMTMQWLG